MNMVTVQQTSQGLLRYLQQQDPVRLQRRGLAVGYDARHNSRQFALLTAACAVAEGVPVWLFSQPVPTPFVPAAVQQLVSWQMSAPLSTGRCHNTTNTTNCRILVARSHTHAQS
jgi:hypothetical protein